MCLTTGSIEWHPARQDTQDTWKIRKTDRKRDLSLPARGNREVPSRPSQWQVWQVSTPPTRLTPRSCVARRATGQHLRMRPRRLSDQKDWGTTRITLHSALSHSKALQTWIIWCHMIMINRHDEYMNVMDDDVWHVSKTVAWCRGQRSRVLLQKKEVLFRVCRRSTDIQGLICVLDHHGFIMIYSIFFGFSKRMFNRIKRY